jgi:hypothetical protein
MSEAKSTWQGTDPLLCKWENDPLVADARAQGKPLKTLRSLARYLELMEEMKEDSKPVPVTVKDRLLSIVYSPITLSIILYEEVYFKVRYWARRHRLRIIEDLFVIVVLAPIGMPILLWEWLQRKRKG